jgi:hypothetical protein
MLIDKWTSWIFFWWLYVLDKQNANKIIDKFINKKILGDPRWLGRFISQCIWLKYKGILEKWEAEKEEFFWNALNNQMWKQNQFI